MSGTALLVTLWAVAIVSAALSFLAWWRLSRPAEVDGGDEPEQTEKHDEDAGGDTEAT